jgi:hypothetical protein
MGEDEIERRLTLVYQNKLDNRNIILNTLHYVIDVVDT